MLSLRPLARPEPPAAVVAGAMCGLGYTFVPFLPLELLMWGWMVPLLLSLRGETRFWRVYGRGAGAMFVALLVACWWIALPSVRVGAVGIGLGTLFMSVPWAAFWGVQRLAGRRVALWSFPLVWMAWEAAMLATPIAPAGNVLANAQGRLTWLVQMADLGGAALVTGWVVLVNVALTATVERWQAREAASRAADGPYTASDAPQAPLERSQPRFDGPHHHPVETPRLPPTHQPPTPNDQHPSRRALSPPRRRLATALARTLALALAPPLAYAAARMATLPPEASTIRVALVQPNRIPSEVVTRGDFEAASLATLALAEAAIGADPARRPDLVVLPEAAFLGDLRRDAAARLDLSLLVARTGVPVLSGMVARPWVAPAARSPTLRAAGRAHLQQNAAALVTPALARRRWTPADTLAAPGADPAVYAKRRLIPFVEGMPYANRGSALARFGLALSPLGLYDAREGRAAPLAFADRRGRGWRVGVLICYEQFYGADAADAVRQGAAFLAAPTNESWFARTSGSRLISVAARLRAIETRRTLVRATSTGLTGAIDARGRPYGEVPTWTALTTTADVALRTDRTVFVRAPHAVPIASALALAGVVLAGGIGAVRRRLRSPQARSS